MQFLVALRSLGLDLRRPHDVVFNDALNLAMFTAGLTMGLGFLEAGLKIGMSGASAVLCGVFAFCVAGILSVALDLKWMPD